MLDASGLAFYILDVETSGMQSLNDEIIPYATFPFDFWESEPFSVFVGYAQDMVGDPGETVQIEIDIINYRFVSDIFEVTVTDQQGWGITPQNQLVALDEWETQNILIDVDIPADRAGENIIEITATSVSEPWRTNTSSVQIRAGNDPPDAPTITGEINGKKGVEYDYTFAANEPDGDDVYLWIIWGDGCPALEWIGPYESNEDVIVSHIFTSEGTFTISAQAKDVYDAEGDWGELDVTMPRNKIVYRPFLNFLKIHLNMFPILRNLLGLP